MSSRRQRARQIRNAAADIAHDRQPEPQTANDEEYRYRFDAGHPHVGKPSYIARFTKGLPHGEDGLLLDPRDYDDFSSAIESGEYERFRRVRIGPRASVDANRDADSQNNPPSAPEWHAADAAVGVRKWESPTAGHVYDLQGPDAQSLAIDQAPELDSDESIAEMGEDYAMALLRDVPFSSFDTDSAASEALDSLQKLAWFNDSSLPGLSDQERQRRRSLVDSSPSDLFRGLTAGDQVGPYLSQFLLVGTGPRGGAAQSRDSGQTDYGAVRIDMRVRQATPNLDYMTLWSKWLDVQNGAAVSEPAGAFVDELGDAVYRHITTPRDMATYVHFDQLYQAYLNAAFVLFENGAPLDRGLPLNDEPTQTGFATFGGPHLLALLTEVSARALKAVRYQKFNVHRRPRPEAVGGLLDALDRGQTGHGMGVMKRMREEFLNAGLLDLVRVHNKTQNFEMAEHPLDREDSVLLPMAFVEGSPMHPAYGAGHATVAGACTTILKAWFDCDHPLGFAYQSNATGTALDDLGDQGLTVGGELDKLAANISIARNMAGVHFFTDYWESLLMGEKIALGILEEQKLTYPESFRVTIPPFKPAPVLALES